MSKSLNDLTIRDNFMFAAVMLKDDNCKKFLEILLAIEIDRIVINNEECIVYNPEYKGIRLDVYGKDEHNTCYNIEMQVGTGELAKRIRYYHSQIDMELLSSGQDYEKLPKSYVIFICDFDPFGEKKYCYTFENRCLEDLNLGLGDESISILLSTKGKNENDVSSELVKFLQFVRENTSHDNHDYGSDLVRQLQNSMVEIKKSREMGRRFMLMKDLLRDERKAGYKEGIEEHNTILQEINCALEKFGTIPGSVFYQLYNQLYSQTDLEVLKQVKELAQKSNTLDEFHNNIQILLDTSNKSENNS